MMMMMTRKRMMRQKGVLKEERAILRLPIALTSWKKTRRHWNPVVSRDGSDWAVRE